MNIIIDQIDDAYFFLADKTESFWCKYHNEAKEFLFINRQEDWTINIFDPSNGKILQVDQTFFDENYNIVWHPIYLWQLIDMMDARLKEIFTATTNEWFSRYVYLAKFVVDAWTIKANPLESACPSEELFNNLIKIIWDFFDDPKISEYKSSTTAEDEAKATGELLNPKSKKKWNKNKQSKKS